MKIIVFFAAIIFLGFSMALVSAFIITITHTYVSESGWGYVFDTGLGMVIFGIVGGPIVIALICLVGWIQETRESR